jgi:carboxylesterase
MKLAAVPSDLKTVRSALPLKYTGNNTHGVLLFHGYTGYPGEMQYLAAQVHERSGDTVVVPRWPGHGTSGRDFLESTWRDWLRRAVDSYLDLASVCETVSLVGLSMGGVLALLVASVFPTRRLVLLAPALETTNRFLPLSPLLRFLVPPHRKSADGWGKESEPDRRYLAEQYWSRQWPAQGASLWRLITRARRRLSRVSAPVLVMVSERDQAVPISVVDRIQRSIGSEEFASIVLKESDHVLCNGTEKERVANATFRFLTNGLVD